MLAWLNSMLFIQQDEAYLHTENNPKCVIWPGPRSHHLGKVQSLQPTGYAHRLH